MSGEISVINTIDTAHEDMIVSYCFTVVFIDRQISNNTNTSLYRSVLYLEY